MTRFRLTDEEKANYDRYFSKKWAAEVDASTAIEERPVLAAQVCSSGIHSLDYALGGGLPSGLVEVYGAEGEGKTTLLYAMLANAQRHSIGTVLLQSEYFDAPRVERLGIDPADLLVVRTKSLEDASAVIKDLLSATDDVILAVDSLTSLRPSDDSPGRWQAVLSEELPTWGEALRPRSALVVLNQVRARKSADRRKMFAGGTNSAAVKLAEEFAVRLEVSRTEVSEKCYTLVINIVANVLRCPSLVAQVPASKEDGVDVHLDLVRFGVAHGLIERRGSWVYLGTTRLGQGEVEAARSLVALSIRHLI